jgi:hypothetical protein
VAVKTPGRGANSLAAGARPPSVLRRRAWWLLGVNALAELLMWSSGYLGFVRLDGELGGVGPQPSPLVVDGLQLIAGLAFGVVVATAAIVAGQAIRQHRVLRVIQKVGAGVACAGALLIVGLLAYWMYCFLTTPWTF